MPTLTDAQWQSIAKRSPDDIPALMAFLHCPAAQAIPERISQALAVPLECTTAIPAHDGVLWSRRLLQHFRQTDGKVALVDGEALRYASQSENTWRRMAAYLGARRLARALARRVQRSQLEVVLDLAGPDALQFARRPLLDDPLVLDDTQEWSNEQIAARLVVSPATAKTHVSRTMVKLHARDRAQLVVLAYETGLVKPGWLG